MQTLKGALPGFVAACLLVAAQADGEVIEVPIGNLSVRFEAPDDWEFIRRDSEFVIRKDIEQIHLFDSGPVTPSGFEREIRQARLLFRNRQFDQASEILRGTRLRAAFPTAAQWQSVSRYWYRMSRTGSARHSTDLKVVEQAFDEVLNALATLRTPDFESLVTGTLATLEPLDRRELVATLPVVVDGRTGLQVETWDRLTHSQRTRYLFVSAGESLLILRTGFGEFERIEPFFEALAASIEF